MMTSAATSIDRLVSTGRLAEAGVVAARSLPAGDSALRDELLVWQSQLTDLERRERSGAVGAALQSKLRRKLAVQLVQLARAIDDLGDVLGQRPPAGAVAPPPAAESTCSARSVFLSYGHADTEVAAAVARHLRAAGHAVTIDSQDMVAGSSIVAFIQSSVRSTDATVCLVSAASLLSGWVCQETVLALGEQALWGRRRFIACALDQRFLEPGFRLEATFEIDRRLADIDRLLPQYIEQRIDSNDLNDERSRLHALRHHLGAVLSHLRASLCLDLREPARAVGLARLLDSLGAPQRLTGAGDRR